MKYFRVSLLLFVLVLIFMFNIERLDVATMPDAINIETITYIITAIASVTILSIPLIGKLKGGLALTSLVIFWLGMYGIGKAVSFFFFSGRPLFGDPYTYLTITEITLLTIVILLSHRLAAALDDFETSVEDITFATYLQGSRILPFETADEDIDLEMFRSRQFQHPLSLLIVTPQTDSLELSMTKAVQEVQQNLAKRYALHNISQRLSRYLRRTDTILEQWDQNRFMVLCPETTASDSEVLATHIQSVIEQDMGITTECRTATFPDQALTFEELIAQATLNEAKSE